MLDINTELPIIERVGGVGLNSKLLLSSGGVTDSIKAKTIAAGVPAAIKQGFGVIVSCENT